MRQVRLTASLAWDMVTTQITGYQEEASAVRFKSSWLRFSKVTDALSDHD